MMENNSDSGCSDFEVECVEDEEYSQVLNFKYGTATKKIV